MKTIRNTPLRITVLLVGPVFFSACFFSSLQNGFNRSDLSTWLSLFLGIMVLVNARFLWIRGQATPHRSVSSEAAPKYNGPEKRSHYRVMYEPNRRPKLVLQDTLFEVVDISEKGLRLINPKGITLHRPIEGTVMFPDGDSVPITGDIEWEKEGHVSLRMDTPLSHSFIRKELANLL